MVTTGNTEAAGRWAGADDSALASERIDVALGARSYEIIVGNGLLTKAADYVSAVAEPKKLAIVTDETVASLHLDTLLTGLRRTAADVSLTTIPPGEAAKTFGTVQAVAETLLASGIERATTIIAFGGGVVGDLAGFLSSILLRGIPFIQIPTTLLAMVDSSVGGKTGINTSTGKNLVGTFFQPRLVLADTAVLGTLPHREMLAGYAEVVKYGLLGDPIFFAWLESRGRQMLNGDSIALRQAIAECCRAKARIVAADERESGSRALLNLGHTFGHAMEAEAGMRGTLLHGEAVAVGMVMAFALSSRLGLCPAADAARARSVLQASGLPVSFADLDALGVGASEWEDDRLLAHMSRDKKVRDGRVTFILARRIGETFVTQDVDPATLRTFVEDFRLGRV